MEPKSVSKSLTDSAEVTPSRCGSVSSERDYTDGIGLEKGDLDWVSGLEKSSSNQFPRESGRIESGGTLNLTLCFCPMHSPPNMGNEELRLAELRRLGVLPPSQRSASTGTPA